MLDAAGRSVTTRVYAVEESLATTLVFDEKLSAGIYMVEMTNAGHVTTERLVVQ
ncbi:MAG: T9SS type A sorting domain-containing protein [Flavobacteriales bacterium]